MINENYTLQIFKGQGLYHASKGYGVIHQVPQIRVMLGLNPNGEPQYKFVNDLKNILVGFKDGETHVDAAACEPAAMPFAEMLHLRTKYGMVELELESAGEETENV